MAYLDEAKPGEVTITKRLDAIEAAFRPGEIARSALTRLAETSHGTMPTLHLGTHLIAATTRDARQLIESIAEELGVDVPEATANDCSLSYELAVSGQRIIVSGLLSAAQKAKIAEADSTRRAAAEASSKLIATMIEEDEEA